MNNKLLYYDCINQFKINFFKDLLTLQHLNGGEIRIDKLNFPDGGEIPDFNFWGHVLEKDGVKYLLPNRDNSGNNLDVASYFPIIAKDLQKVAYRGNVYWLINKAIPARFKSEKTMSFKQLVDILSSLNHSNVEHQKLMTLIGLTSMMSRANYRISSPPSFGKDSVVDTMGNLFGNAATIENPTIAKLEYMSIYKWLVVNEVIDIKNSDWKIIEQFLLSAGAYRPQITKHSRAKDGVKEILDIKELSLSLLYNDIDCYPKFEEYIDFIAKKAVLDRFPCFRFYGKYLEDFNSIKNDDINELVKKNEKFYKDLIYAFTYYKSNLIYEFKGFDCRKIIKLPQRWDLSIGKLLNIVDLYCDNQEEFDKWINVINKSIQDYETMLEYPRLYLNVINKLSSPSKIKDLNQQLKIKDTFLDKNNLLYNFNDKKEEVLNNNFWGD